MFRRIATISCAAALSLGVLVSGDALAELPRIGQAAPAFSLPSLPRRPIETTLQSLQGKVVFLDFWASWCVPCRAEFPILQRLSERYRQRGLRVVGVTVDQDATPARGFVERTGARFLILHDANRAVADRYAPPSMPTSYVIDRGGILRHINRGFEPTDEAKFERQILGLLGN